MALKDNQKIDLGMLRTVFTHMAINGTEYGLGAKAPSLTVDSINIHKIDCSGFTRYAIARATDQKLIIPDGSVNQHDWCEEQGLHKVDYPNVAIADDSRLFIAFIPPAPSGHPGHVWFINGGNTMESHGGVGVSTRHWDNPILLHAVTACYELPTA
jgi:cell wall-associated NlpC family hydrolase